MQTSRFALLFAFLLSFGCGKSEPEPKLPTIDNVGTLPADVTSDSAAQNSPPKKEEPKPAEKPPEPYQLDPTKQVIPTTSVAGMLNGKTFAPTVNYSGGALSFRVLPTKPGESESSFMFSIPANTTKLIVKPDQPASDAVPRIDTFAMIDDKPKLQSFLNGYGLTLELDKPQNGKLAGKIYLALPDDAKSYIAGIFTAEVLRQPDELPGSDDVPYLQGALTIAGDKKGELEVGRIAAPGGAVSVETVTLMLDGPGPRLARTDSGKPTAAVLTSKGEFRYEHTRLLPGRYLIWAKLKTGGATWQWIDVTAESKQELALKIDPAAIGKVKVTLPKDINGIVRLLPMDDKKDAERVPDTALDFMFKLEASPTAGVATIEKIPTGKYRVIVLTPGNFTPVLTGEVTIEIGKEATVELKAN